MNLTLKKIVCRILDICALPLAFVYLPVLRQIRKRGVQFFPLHKKRFKASGVFPIRDHYYEPQLTYSETFDAARPRDLPFAFSVHEQLMPLSNLKFVEELPLLPFDGNPKGNLFYRNNPAFGPGDADLYYLLIRNCKPRQIIEIGSGFSTLLACEAIKRNKEEGLNTSLCCIEPFEKNWLDTLPGIELIRKKVESVSWDVFDRLEENDILFIDSSHIIRPENDVLFIYLELLPRLKKGVVIHIHDIFSPRHYREDWLKEEFRFWNEQYLLEAFLSFNDSFEVMYAVNHLTKDAFTETKKTLVSINPDSEPSSFWMRKIK